MFNFSESASKSYSEADRHVIIKKSPCIVLNLLPLSSDGEKFTPNGLLSRKGQETSLLNVKKGSGAKPSSYSMVIEGVFPKGKAAGREAIIHLHLESSLKSE